MVEKWDLGFYFSSESQWLEGWKILEPQDTQKETRAGGTGPHLLARKKGCRKISFLLSERKDHKMSAGLMARS